MADAASGAGGDKPKERKVEDAAEPGQQDAEKQAMAAMGGGAEGEFEVDASKVEAVMSSLKARMTEKAKLEASRDALLAAVEVSDEDIAALADACGATKKQAELRLREAGGKVDVALARMVGVRVAGSHAE